MPKKAITPKRSYGGLSSYGPLDEDVKASSVSPSPTTKISPRRKGARKVAILGYAEETRDLVFQLPEDVEIWGINAAHFFIYASKPDGTITPRTKAKATNWFQLHPRDWQNAKGEMTGFFGRPKEHIDFLSKFDGTVWLQKEDKEIPNGKAYPLAEIVKESGRQYFTSTFAYQAGLAWYQHVIEKNPIDTLYIYGVNLSSIDEYIHQKPCVEYWCGRLQQAGVKIVVPDGSSILKGDLYAFSGAGGELSDHAFDRLQYWKGKYMESWANVNTMLSMKTETEFWARTLSGVVEKFPEKLDEEVRAAIQQVFTERTQAINGMVERAGAELNGALGMVKDNQHWLALTGGIDHRAPTLPELRIPSAQLAENFSIPEQRSI